MNRYRPLLPLIALTALLLPSIGRGAEQVIWASTIDEAWELAQEHNRPMLVFVTRSGCKYCTKMKATTFANELVAQQVNNHFVPVVVSPATAQSLINELGIKSFPTTLLIMPDYTMADQIKGFLPPDQMRRRLTGVFDRVAAEHARKMR